ncbi:MAG TPA: stage III sporulation protein AF [Lachnospiraceae bacterium]|nr:stage III sporulation protein AF [Lachnospiraceae bacterium]
MGDGLLQTIRQVGVFVICAQMILHFKPAESYGKYIRLLVSVMVLVQLFVPIMGIFIKSDAGNFTERISYYEDILSENMEDISVTCENAEQMLNNMTMEEIKTRINNASEEEKQPDSVEIEHDEIQEDNPIQMGNEYTTDTGEEENQDIVIKRIEVLTDD